jgi:hypothetical protein
MSRARTLLGTLGLVVFVVGVFTVFNPAFAAAIPVQGVAESIGGPWVFVAAFGVLAVAVVVAVLLARGVEGIDESRPPDPEDVYRVPHPGQEFDDFVEDGVGVRERLFGDRHQRTRERVATAALTTLERTRGLSRDEARDAIARGTWTDDAAAASFLSSRRTPGLSERLVAVFRGESTFQHGARRAAQEVSRLHGGDR